MPTETTKEAEPDVPPTCAVGMLIPVRCRPLHLLHHQQLRKAVSIAPETRGTGWTRFLNRGDEVPGGLPSPRSPKKSENPRSVDQNNEVRNPGKTAKPLPLSARSNWHAPTLLTKIPPPTHPTRYRQNRPRVDQQQVTAGSSDGFSAVRHPRSTTASENRRCFSSKKRVLETRPSHSHGPAPQTHASPTKLETLHFVDQKPENLNPGKLQKPTT